jgi:arsenical pump membrane protein
MILTMIIFAASIGLLMMRPKPLNEATAVALGAVTMLILSLISPLQTWQTLQENANVLLFFLGLMIISVVAEQAGFFQWCAIKAVKLAGTKGPALLGVVFGLGALITAFFSNDATALILTPLVFAIVKRHNLNPLPYVFACAFIANSASMLLPVSNPVNLLAVEKFHLTLGQYLKFLLFPSLVVIGANLILFRWIFRKDIFAVKHNDQSDETPKIDRFFLAVSIGLILTALGYILVSLYGLPLAYPALGSAVILLACGFGFKRIKIKTVASGISWSIFLFIFALALLVKGLENAGVIKIIADELAKLAAHGPLQALFSVTLGTALGSNLINNWSMMMVSVSSLGAMSAQSATFNNSLVYGAIMGADIGPNLTILGSLSSMLWLVLLRQRGLDIRPMQYIKLGLIVTPVLLVIGVLSLYLCGVLWG